MAYDLLGGEVLRRARALAVAGMDGLFAGLTAQTVWRPPRLALIKPHRMEIDARDRSLVLIPLVFAAGVRPISWDSDAVYVTYQAAGAAALADTGLRPRPSALALLLGAGRAQILEAVAEPANTRALARRLDLAPSTVSEHLGQLVAAGVVRRQRSDHRVYYHANDRGRALLELFAS